MATTPMGEPGGVTMRPMATEARWWLALRGIIAILFGFILWTWPAMTLRILTRVFGIFVIAAGIFAILSGLRATQARHRWLHIGEGALGVLVGIISLAWPAITAIALLYLIAGWAIATGIMEIGGAFQRGRAAGTEFLLILSGVVSIIFGILLIVWPHLGLLALLWLFGIYVVVYGVILLVHAISGRPLMFPPRRGAAYGPGAPTV